jgi:serine/threonine-protein kinase
MAAVDHALRVVLADDSDLVRGAIARVLRDCGIDVVGEAADPARLRAVVATARPDVAVVDIRMPPDFEDGGLRAAMGIRRDFPATGVLVLSAHLEVRHVFGLLDCGHDRIGFLHKDRAGAIDEFADCLRRVHAGERVVDARIAAELLRGGRSDGLTERERDVAALMAQGRSNLAISRLLGMGLRTVESHIRGIFVKYGLPEVPDDHRRVLAVLYYLRGHEG